MILKLVDWLKVIKKLKDSMLWVRYAIPLTMFYHRKPNDSFILNHASTESEASIFKGQLLLTACLNQHLNFIIIACSSPSQGLVSKLESQAEEVFGNVENSFSLTFDYDHILLPGGFMLFKPKKVV